MLGVIIGLVIGLAIALVVAIYITNAPVPFVTKVQRPTDNAPAASTDGRLPDPNRPLYGNVPMPKGDAPKAEAAKAEPPKVADAKQATPGKTAPADDASRYLLEVNLDDPSFQERTVELLLHGQDGVDFAQYVNAVSVKLRRTHGSGRAS